MRGERGDAIVETLFVVMPLVLLMTGVLALGAYVRAEMRLFDAAYYVEESIARAGSYTAAAAQAAAQLLQGCSSWHVSAPSGTVPPSTEFTVAVQGSCGLPIGFWQGALPAEMGVTVTGETFPTAP